MGCGYAALGLFVFIYASGIRGEFFSSWFWERTKDTMNYFEIRFQCYIFVVNHKFCQYDTPGYWKAFNNLFGIIDETKV